jgi:tetratricopeptide (TPR) repeat protein
VLNLVAASSAMSPRPLIFISAVSRELRSARQLVANTLTFLGYEPVWQDIFGTEGGDLREILRQQIDQCKGVVQLVGQCYGAEPPSADEQFGRVSYTQYEALYARQRGKKVWYLFIDEHFPIDPCDRESAEARDLQAAYRRRLQADTHLFHPLTSAEALEASVLKLRDDLVHLRRGAKQWATGVAILLIISVALGLWLLHGQRGTARQMGETKQAVAAMTEEMTKLRQGIMQYTQVEAQVRQSQSGQDTGGVQERVYAQLGKQLDLDANLVRKKLPQVAENLKSAPDATSYERANAAYVSNDYSEAERLSLQAAEEAKNAPSAKPSDIVQALKLAGLSAQKRIQYASAMAHFREAEKLMDRQRNPEEWAEVQHAIADLLLDQGRYNDAANILRDVVEVRGQVFGSEHPETLRSRNRLAYALWRQGRYADAQADFRQVVLLEEKALGREHPDTLLSRNGLAIALDDGGKHSDAEAEHREVLKIREKVLGAEHPDTLRSRNNLALALNRQGKYAEAETDFRELIKLEEKVLGPEHPDTLRSRSNLIVALGNQHKDSEAETEFGELIKLEEKVLGPEHPDTLRSRSNLAYALARQGKYAEAENDFREAIKTEEKVLGPQHPATLGSRGGLTSVLTSQGKYAEAEAECRDLIQVEEKVLGPEHLSTLDSCYNLAFDLARQGKIQEATQFARRAAESAVKVLGPNHPSTEKYAELLRDLKGRQ